MNVKYDTIPDEVKGWRCNMCKYVHFTKCEALDCCDPTPVQVDAFTCPVCGKIYARAYEAQKCIDQHCDDQQYDVLEN